MIFIGAINDFVSEVDGYLCFVTPAVESGLLMFKWHIQSGGGWTFKGGDSITKHATGEESTVKGAVDSIIHALDKLGAELNGEDGIRAMAQRA